MSLGAACYMIVITGIGCFFIFTIWWLCAREPIATSKLEKFVETEALNGNKLAIRMMKNKYRVLKFENRGIIYAAIDGNENAIEILEDRMKGL